MASVQLNNEDKFNQLRLKLSSDLGKELSESEVIDFILEFGTDNYEKLLNISKLRLRDTGFTEEQYKKALTFIITDVEENDVSENVDAILYG